VGADGFFFAPSVPDVDDCVDVAPWVIVDEEFMSVEAWFADTPLVTLWLPVPKLMPGLMLAAALTSVLLTPTFAFTSTLGFTLSVPRPPDVLLSLGEMPLDDDEPADGEMDCDVVPVVAPLGDEDPLPGV
jgi:hypothetical protein